MELVEKLRAMDAKGAYEHLLALAKENPVHVSVEVFLVLFIAYIILVKRSYDPLKRC